MQDGMSNYKSKMCPGLQRLYGENHFVLMVYSCIPPQDNTRVVTSGWDLKSHTYLLGHLQDLKFNSNEAESVHQSIKGEDIKDIRERNTKALSTEKKEPTIRREEKER